MFTLSGKFQVVGPNATIFAAPGDDVILPCSLDPPTNAEAETLDWTKPGLTPSSVLIRRNRKIEYQHPSFVDRTSLFDSELKNGNVSLKLSRVRLEDAGKYVCVVPPPTPTRKADVHLQVGEGKLK